MTTWPEAGIEWEELAEQHPDLMEKRGRSSPSAQKNNTVGTPREMVVRA